MTARGGVVALVLALTGVGGLAGGCGKDDQESYCDAVQSHQKDLTEVLGSGTPSALLDALPIFRDLRAEAPRDLRDEWKTVVTSLEGLADALDDAGVDPATYDRDKPPSDVTPAERDRIDAASGDLDSPATVQAFAGVQQQARDVCKTPLSL